MNSTNESPIWMKLYMGFTVYMKYVDPILLLISMCGAAFLFVLIIVKKREAHYPTTTATALCCLLLADIGHLTTQLLIDFGHLGVLPLIYHLSERGCLGLAYATTTQVILQAYVQVVISIERWLAVTRPLKVKEYITKKRMICLLLLAAAVSACIGYGYTTLGYTYKQHPIKNVTLCQPRIDKQLQMAFFILFAWILPPIVVMIVCTVGIIKKLISRSRKFRKASDSAQLSSAEKRLSFMLVAMNVTFILTSIPSSITFFYIAFWHSPKISFIWNISIFCTRFGGLTDWIWILLIGSQLRAGLRNMCRRTPNKVTQNKPPSKSSKSTTETDESSGKQQTVVTAM